MSLNQPQLEQYQRQGHLTLNGFYSAGTIQQVIEDINLWADETRSQLTPSDQRWYLEQDVPEGVSLFRKLDNPIYNRPKIRELLVTTELLSVAEQIIGNDLAVFSVRSS